MYAGLQLTLPAQLQIPEARRTYSLVKEQVTPQWPFAW